MPSSRDSSQPRDQMSPGLPGRLFITDSPGSPVLYIIEIENCSVLIKHILSVYCVQIIKIFNNFLLPKIEILPAFLFTAVYVMAHTLL